MVTKKNYSFYIRVPSNSRIDNQPGAQSYDYNSQQQYTGGGGGDYQQTGGAYGAGQQTGGAPAAGSNPFFQ